MEKHLIEKAYICAKENFKKNSFTFKQLFELLSKQESSVKDSAADLYIDILQDIRFISLGKQKWALRENFKYSEISKITSSMFGLDEYHEEDADQYMSDVEKSELKSKSSDDDIDDYIDEDDEDNIDISSSRRTSNLVTDDEEEEIDKESDSSTIVDSDDDEDDDFSDVSDESEEELEDN